MKRYLSIFLIACLLTGCVHGKPRPILRRNYDGNYPGVEQAFQNVVDNTIGKTTFYKKRVMKKTMVPLYDDVLEGREPYLVEDNGDSLTEWRTTTMDGGSGLSFTFYDHEAFDYPLLIMRNQVEEHYIFCIVQFFPDGSYATFNTLEPSAQSILSTGLYTDGNGQLYIDDAYSGAIYELNFVDGVLKVNYGYSNHGRGFATLHLMDFSEDEGRSYPSENYPDGSDVFTKIAIVDETKEPFGEEDMEKLTGGLSKVDALDFNEENFNEIASRYTDGAPKKKGSNETGNDESAIRQFAAENFSIYTSDDGVNCLWVYDYDHTGKLSAYGVSEEDVAIKLIYIDENLNARKVRELNKNFFVYAPKLLKAGNDAYLHLNQTGATGGTGYLYGVKDNEVYEPDLSSKIDLFDKVGNQFVNNETYLEMTEIGGVRKERETFYDYDQRSRQFVKSKKKELMAQAGKVNVIIEGNDVGPVDVLIRDGTIYYPVGEMNRLLVENFRLEGISKEEKRMFFENTTTYCMKDEETNAWYFLTWPGAGNEMFEGYFVEKNIIIDLFDDYDAPGSYDYMRPKHKPIEKEQALYMDGDTLKANFAMDYEEGRGTIKITEAYGKRGDEWKIIKASGNQEVHDVVQNNF